MSEQRDAASLEGFKWPLGGYAPGHYMNTCRSCGDTVLNVDKRATQCLRCAIEATRPTATARRPHCETCGKDVHEILCPVCAKWWEENKPDATAPVDDGEVWAEADTLADEICGCATASQHRADVKKLLAYRTAAERQGIAGHFLYRRRSERLDCHRDQG